MKQYFTSDPATNLLVPLILPLFLAAALFPSVVLTPISRSWSWPPFLSCSPFTQSIFLSTPPPPGRRNWKVTTNICPDALKARNVPWKNCGLFTIDYRRSIFCREIGHRLPCRTSSLLKYLLYESYRPPGYFCASVRLFHLKKNTICLLFLECQHYPVTIFRLYESELEMGVEMVLYCKLRL